MKFISPSFPGETLELRSSVRNELRQPVLLFRRGVRGQENSGERDHDACNDGRHTMRMLLLRAYPRKNGFTRRLTDLFVKGALEAGADLVDRDLPSLDIKQCLGCYGCWVTSPGTCVIRDDMATILKDILDAEMVVCATPLNAFTVSSHLKNVLDRTLPLTQSKFEQSPTRHGAQRPALPRKMAQENRLDRGGRVQGRREFLRGEEHVLAVCQRHVHGTVRRAYKARIVPAAVHACQTAHGQVDRGRLCQGGLRARVRKAPSRPRRSARPRRRSRRTFPISESTRTSTGNTPLQWENNRTTWTF